MRREYRFDFDDVPDHLLDLKAITEERGDTIDAIRDVKLDSKDRLSWMCRDGNSLYRATLDDNDLTISFLGNTQPTRTDEAVRNDARKCTSGKSHACGNACISLNKKCRQGVSSDAAAKGKAIKESLKQSAKTTKPAKPKGAAFSGESDGQGALFGTKKKVTSAATKEPKTGAAESAVKSAKSKAKAKEAVPVEPKVAEKGGAIVLSRGGALASQRKSKPSQETVNVRGTAYRKRDMSTLEAFEAVRKKTLKRQDELEARVRALKKENKNLKGKENSTKRSENNSEIKRLERRAKVIESRYHKIVARGLSVKGKGASFAFSQAGSKKVMGITLKHRYSAQRILGIRPGATVAEATNAYRNLAKRYHPDAPQNHNASERTKTRNQRKFQLATEAYESYKEWHKRGLF